MNRLLSLAAPQIIFAAAFLFFLGWNAPNAHAQLKLCPKVGGNCTATGPVTTTTTTDEEDAEEPPAPTPTVGNKSFSFYDLSSSSSLTKTDDSSSSKTFKPDVNKSYTKTKHGRTYTRQGSVEFDGEEDFRRSCAWIPDTFPLKNKIIRIYYTLKFDKDRENNQGEGTVLAFLPGSTSISSSLCGGYGEYLGFADRTGYTSMPEPRFGIEFDINRNTSDGFQDPDNNHLAIVNNGVKHDGADSPDCPNSNSNNVTSSPYGACWTGTNVTRSSMLQLPSPLFPWEIQQVQVPETTQVADSDEDHHGSSSYPWLEEDKTHGFRVEITGSSANCAATEIYVKAWACKNDDSSCNGNSFKTITSAYTGSATATVAKCVPFNPATYDSVVVGYTFGSGDHGSKAKYGSFTMQTFDP
ncbi:MAG: hypothetical protein EPN26_15705 [Rhodospirillales bacterium]|nr:MAG: hypothetical protein EPN26_15705 [Rhodospirillales bacterium]